MEPEPVPWPNWVFDYQFYLLIVLVSGTSIGPFVMPIANLLTNVMDWCHTIYQQFIALFNQRPQPAEPVLHDAH